MGLEALGQEVVEGEIAPSPKKQRIPPETSFIFAIKRARSLLAFVLFLGGGEQGDASRD